MFQCFIHVVILGLDGKHGKNLRQILQRPLYRMPPN